MSRPLLPPRGVFVPTVMIYNHEYFPAVVHTWIQLRGLAWDRPETPQLSMNQLSEITDKSPSTLYGHLALLRSWGALRMRHSVKGTFIVTFPADTGEFFLDGDSLTYQEESENPDSPRNDLEGMDYESNFSESDSRFLESSPKFWTAPACERSRLLSPSGVKPPL